MGERTSERFFLWNPALKGIAFLLLFFSSALVSAVEHVPDSLRRDEASHYDRLLNTVAAEGKIRVIVGAVPPLISGGRSAAVEGMSEQRHRISQIQESLLNSIRISGRNGMKRFTFIPFIAVEVDEAELRSLMHHPMVGSIEEDKPNGLLLQQSVPLIGADRGESIQYTGAGQTIAILDTGVDKTHPFLSGKIVDEACFSTNDLNRRVTSLCPNGQIAQIGSGSGVNCPPSFRACFHGTHVAGIAAGRTMVLPDFSSIRGVAPDANVIAIQVYSAIADPVLCSQFNNPSPCILTFDSDVLSALDYVLALKDTYAIASVNLSTGGGKYVTNCDAVRPSFKAVVDQLRLFGIATIVSSGNDGFTDALSSPACVSSAVSVGATEHYGSNGLPEQVAPYSNSASFLTLLAPGGCVDSLTACGILSSVPSVFGSSWAFAAGTSSAAPHVAGAWAILKEKNPLATVDELLGVLQSTGIPFTDSRTGAGGVAANVTKTRIQVDAALAALPSSCAAVLSSDMSLYVPVIDFGGSFLGGHGLCSWSAQENSLFCTVIDYGQVDPRDYANCEASTLTSDVRGLHIPVAIYNNIAYQADFVNVPTSDGSITFKLTSFAETVP